MPQSQMSEPKQGKKCNCSEEMPGVRCHCYMAEQLSTRYHSLGWWGRGVMEQGISKIFPYELSRKNIQVERKPVLVSESEQDEESSFEMELPNTDFENTK